MQYIVRVNEKFVAPEGLARRSRATRFHCVVAAQDAGMATTCEPYQGEQERTRAWAQARDEKRFEIINL